jgi:integrase
MKAQITVKNIPTFKPQEKPYEVTDNGLVLRVQPSGMATFYAVYRVNGRNSRFRIARAGQFVKKDNGTYSFKPAVHPDVARTVLKEKAGEAATGKDPQAERKHQRAEEKSSKSKTVGGFYTRHYTPWLLIERKSGKATAKRLKTCFEWLFDKPMKDITPFLLQSWCKKKLGVGRSPHTVNRDMVALKAMLSKAVEWDLLDQHPLLKLKRTKAADNSRVRFLLPDEEKRLSDGLALREAKRREERTSYNEWRKQRKLDPLPEIPVNNFTDHLKPVVLLALNTGLRRGELFSLEWRDIDFLHNRLTVRSAATKGGKSRHIPLNPTSRDTLKRWQKQTSMGGLVFPGKEGERLNNISTAWRKLVSDSKIEDFTFHDLRHCFATKVLKGGADIVTVSKLLGHSDLKMTLRYAHVGDEALTKAVEGI